MPYKFLQVLSPHSVMACSLKAKNSRLQANTLTREENLHFLESDHAHNVLITFLIQSPPILESYLPRGHISKILKHEIRSLSINLASKPDKEPLQMHVGI